MKKLLKKNASYTVSISIVQNPFKLIKNKMLHFTLLIGVFAFTSCTNDDPQPEPPASTGELYTLKYKSQEILELKQMQAGRKYRISLLKNQISILENAYHLPAQPNCN